LKEDRVNGVQTDTDSDDRVLFGQDIEISRVDSSTNTNTNTNTNDGAVPSASTSTSETVGNALTDSTTGTGTDLNSNSKEDTSFFNFEEDISSSSYGSNNKASHVDLLKLPLLGNDAQFYRKFSQTQVSWLYVS